MPKQPAADEVEVEEEEVGGPRSQMWKHEAMVEWINDEEGVDLDTFSAADIIAYAFAKRVAWRKSQDYRDLVESHKADAEEAKAAKAAERKAAADKAAAEKASQPKAASTKSKKGTEPKAAKKATKATKASASDSDENPFE